MKLLPALTLENIRANAVRHGVATDDEIDRLIDGLYAVARDPGTFIGNPRMVQVVGEQP